MADEDAEVAQAAAAAATRAVKRDRLERPRSSLLPIILVAAALLSIALVAFNDQDPSAPVEPRSTAPVTTPAPAPSAN